MIDSHRSPPTGTEPTQAGARRSTAVLAATGLGLGVLLSVLDQTIVAIALRAITADLGRADLVGWVGTAYLLASTSTAVLYGRVSDHVGRRATYLAAVGLFTAASAACALAPSLPALILARVVQGIGAGALFVIPTIAISELFPHARGRAQGAIGAIFGIAALVGPLVGGALVEFGGWETIFWVNLPVGLLALALTAPSLRLPRVVPSGRLDLAGAALLSTAFLALMLALDRAMNSQPWPVAVLVGLLAVATSCVIALRRVERRATDPVLPLSLGRQPALVWVVLASALVGVLIYGSVFYMPTFLQAALGLGPTAAGLGGLPYVAAFAAASALAGRWIDRRGFTGGVLRSGAAAALLAAVFLATLTPDASYLGVAARLVVLGFGVGLVMQPLVTLGQTIADDSDLGAASSAILTARGFGGALGVAAFGALLGHRLTDLAGTPERLAVAVSQVFILGVPAAALLLLTVAAATRPSARSEDDAYHHRPGTGEARYNHEGST